MFPHRYFSHCGLAQKNSEETDSMFLLHRLWVDVFTPMISEGVFQAGTKGFVVRGKGGGGNIYTVMIFPALYLL